MTSINQDFTSYAGDDLHVVFTIRDGDGAVIPLGEANDIVWKLYDEFDALVLSRSKGDDEIIFVTDGDDGQISVVVSEEAAGVTADLSGWYWHAAYVVDSQGNVSTFEIGRGLFWAQTSTPTPPDTVPDAFSFTDVASANLSTAVTSNTITVAGITRATPISIESGTYSINGGNYTAADGEVEAGDTVSVKVTASDEYETEVEATLIIGTVTGVFRVTTGTPDEVPDEFTFTPVLGATVSTVYTSNTITVAGIDTPSPISITGGTYSKNGGSYTAASGSVEVGDTIAVRVTSSPSEVTEVSATVTIGGVSGTYTVTTIDTTPDEFVFIPVTDADLSTVYTSNSITVAGLVFSAPISITGGTYSKNGGSYTSSPGTVDNGDTVTVRVTSGDALGVDSSATLTIGSGNGVYLVSTPEVDTTPDAFTFVDVASAQFNTVYTSNTIAVTGINTAAAISIVGGGEYSVNGGSYTSSPGTVDEGDTVSVRVTTGVVEGAAINAVLTIGGVSDTYSVAVPTPILDRVSVAPIAAWSLGRVLKTGKATISGTTSALTQVLDQIGTNHLTPQGFTAVVAAGSTGIVGQALPETAGLPYLMTDNTNDYLSVTSDITIGSAMSIAVALGKKSADNDAIMGKHGNAAPFVKLQTTQAQIRGAGSTVTAVGGWTLPEEFNYLIMTYDGANVNFYINASDSNGTPVLWATAACTGAIGIFNDILSNQSTNFFNGGFGELILWDVALGATDRAAVMKSGEAAWRSSYYVDPDASDNTAVGWSSALPKKNFDEIGVTGTRICKPGFRAKVKRGATTPVMRGHPFFVTGSGATQIGTSTKHNVVQSYGTGNAAEIRLSKLAAGPWTNVSGTTYSMTWAQPAERVYWLKAGYTPEALKTACDTEYANNPPNFAAAGITNLIEFLAVGSAGGAQAAKTAFYDSGASKLYVNIGIDPTGETLEVPDNTSAGSTASGGRALSVSRVFWDVSGINASFCADDGMSLGASDLTMGSSSDPIILVGGVADAAGGHGGDRHTYAYVTAIGAGTGFDPDGSDGDAFSEHGGNGHLFSHCNDYFCNKAGYDHVFGAGVLSPITHEYCRAAGSPTNYWCSTPAESGLAATRIYNYCEGKHTQVVSDLGYEQPMFRCNGDSSHHEQVVVQITGGTFRGYDSDSTFVGLNSTSGAQVAVITTGLTKSNFGHNYSNSSVNGGVLLVDGVPQ